MIRRASAGPTRGGELNHGRQLPTFAELARTTRGHEPETVLFLTAETGGGHRAATEAISRAIATGCKGEFRTATCDPLTGPEADSLLRRVCGAYGPLTRTAPWLWSLLFWLSNTTATRSVLRGLVARRTVAPIRTAITRHRPSVVVSTHPLLVDPAVVARAASGRHCALVTVVTDLATAHGTWWHPRVDRTIVPSARLLAAGRRAGSANVHARPTGIPVREQFYRARLFQKEGTTLRDTLGIRPGRFVVLVTAGGEGVHGLENWITSIAELSPAVDVVAVCGRNEALRARLSELGDRVGARLLVTGAVDNMAEWISGVDLVVSKAGPSIIAEAASVGVPLLVPAHLPGQETGNAELAVAAGAARRVRGAHQLVEAIEQLRADPALVAAMSDAARRFARPEAALHIARLVTGTARPTGGDDQSPRTSTRKKTP